MVSFDSADCVGSTSAVHLLSCVTVRSQNWSDGFIDSRMPDIYHITHVDNLPGILTEGRLWSDSKRIEMALGNTNIGYAHIKARRMRHPVVVSAKGTLGEYVPFNFCPRSVMLYVVSKGHVDYRGNQSSIIHLVSSVERIQADGLAAFFTDRHADLGYARQFDDLGRLPAEVDWPVMPVRQWGGDQELKEKRQAEFLVHESCPWAAIHEIGVIDQPMVEIVESLIEDELHKPAVRVHRDWYY
jgi:hypothetical protein